MLAGPLLNAYWAPFITFILLFYTQISGVNCFEGFLLVGFAHFKGTVLLVPLQMSKGHFDFFCFLAEL